MNKAILYKKLKNNAVQCLACRHYCRIPENNTGICGVRQNIKGDLYLLVYGSAVAVNTDPMEKKPLFHFLPGSEIFSIGTVGCNFSCQFCQNADISQQGKELKLKLAGEKKLENLPFEIRKYGYDLPPQKIADYCRENKIPSAAFTYNEPVVFFEYARDAMAILKQYGIKTVFVSNGYASKETIKECEGLLDAINIDLKSFSDEFYRRVCGASLEPVLENIKQFHKSGVWVEVTTLIIPGQNDSDQELRKIAEFIKSISPDIPWHISRFWPQYKMTEPEVTSTEILEKAYQIGRRAGLNYVYIGNATSAGKENTYCPECGNLLIKRIGYDVTVEENNFQSGRCQKCGAVIKGVWQ